LNNAGIIKDNARDDERIVRIIGESVGGLWKIKHILVTAVFTCLFLVSSMKNTCF
jgi:predicted alpha/beta superfamily hydrolase